MMMRTIPRHLVATSSLKLRRARSVELSLEDAPYDECKMNRSISKKPDHRRLSLLGVGMSLSLGSILVLQAIAWAQTELTAWQEGEVLTASDLNANFATLRSQMLTSNSFEVIVAALEGAVNGGTSEQSCPDGFKLLSFGLTRVQHTSSGIDGWNLGGRFGCRAEDNTLFAFLEDYQNGSPSTRIECTGQCVRVAP
jgi:hypothetical protein